MCNKGTLICLPLFKSLKCQVGGTFKKIKEMSKVCLPVKSFALVVAVDDPGRHIPQEVLSACVEAGEVTSHQRSLVSWELEEVPVVSFRRTEPVASCGTLQSF